MFNTGEILLFDYKTLKHYRYFALKFYNIIDSIHTIDPCFQTTLIKCSNTGDYIDSIDANTILLVDTTYIITNI